MPGWQDRFVASHHVLAAGQICSALVSLLAAGLTSRRRSHLLAAGLTCSPRVSLARRGSHLLGAGLTCSPRVSLARRGSLTPPKPPTEGLPHFSLPATLELQPAALINEQPLGVGPLFPRSQSELDAAAFRLKRAASWIGSPRAIATQRFARNCFSSMYQPSHPTVELIAEQAGRRPRIGYTGCAASRS